MAGKMPWSIRPAKKWAKEEIGLRAGFFWSDLRNGYRDGFLCFLLLWFFLFCLLQLA